MAIGIGLVDKKHPEIENHLNINEPIYYDRSQDKSATTNTLISLYNQSSDKINSQEFRQARAARGAVSQESIQIWDEMAAQRKMDAIEEESNKRMAEVLCTMAATGKTEFTLSELNHAFAQQEAAQGKDISNRVEIAQALAQKSDQEPSPINEKRGEKPEPSGKGKTHKGCCVIS